jgi:hypothetical protein
MHIMSRGLSDDAYMRGASCHYVLLQTADRVTDMLLNCAMCSRLALFLCQRLYASTPSLCINLCQHAFGTTTPDAPIIFADTACNTWVGAVPF